MPAIAASDVTITVNKEDVRIEGRKRRVLAKIQFGDGVLTYPAAGVPLPAIEKFGLVRNLDYLILFDHDDANGLVWKYDKDNKKIRGYRIQDLVAWNYQGSVAGVDRTAFVPVRHGDATAAGGGEVAKATATVDTDVKAKNSELGELPTTFAPVAQTMFAEAVGW